MIHWHSKIENRPSKVSIQYRHCNEDDNNRKLNYKRNYCVDHIFKSVVYNILILSRFEYWFVHSYKMWVLYPLLAIQIQYKECNIWRAEKTWHIQNEIKCYTEYKSESIRINHLLSGCLSFETLCHLKHDIYHMKKKGNDFYGILNCEISWQPTQMK